MEYVTLGNTGIDVSRICFGSLTMAPQQANLPPSEGAALLNYAFERGINFLDTAQLYENYEHIALALKKWQGNDIVVSSKTYAYTRALAEEAVEEARKKLNRDVIDIFMLHEQESIHTLRGHREALERLLEYKEQGIIRAVGVSMHHVAAVEGAIEVGCVDVIHPMLNVTGLGIVDGGRIEMENAVKKAHDKGIFVLSMKPLGGGNLFAKAEKCLSYVFSRPYVDSVAIGMQTFKEIDANIEFLENGCFSPSAKKHIEGRKRRLVIMDWCEKCGKCMERCTQGALDDSGDIMAVDMNKCVLCGYCAKECNLACIKII